MDELTKIVFMKKMAFICSFLVLQMHMAAQPQSTHDLFVGTFTTEGAEGIYRCEFNSETGQIAEKEIFKAVDNPSFLTVSTDKKYLYAVVREPGPVNSEGGSVVAYRILPNRKLQFLNKQSAHGDDPCYVDVSPDGKWVAIANYGGGNIAVYPVTADGMLKPASDIILHKGSGPNKNRQMKAYAHSVKFSKSGKMLVAADLGCDRLFRYKINENTGKLEPANQPFVELPAGSGPRHFIFSADEKYCYVVNELNSTVVVYVSNDNKLIEIQVVKTIPIDYSGINYCADIHLSADEKMVYVSNRGHNSIAVFSRFENGLIESVTHVATMGNWPRNFTIDPTGKFMLVANQRSNNIVVYRLEKGIPVFENNEIKLMAPVCLRFL